MTQDAKPDGVSPSEREERLAEVAARASRVAHDLNNLVSVILGYSNLLLDQVDADSPARRMAEEVQQAAFQAAELTRQLVEIRREQRALESPGAIPAAPRAATVPRRAHVQSPGDLTVLIVEDDPGVRRLAESVLTRGGFQVLLAAEGQAAVSLCERHPGSIDLLLADVVLPGQGSRDLIARARALRPEMRVLFMSGYESDGIPDAGASFLPKPFTAEVLLSRVKRVLGDDPS